jgi:SsrA-binding protein
MRKRSTGPQKIINRRVRFDYELGDELVVGVVLSGRETKSLRQGHGQLRGAFVDTKDGELWLINATINNGKTFVIEETEQTRPRKLLAKRKEIEAFMAAKQQGRTIVPLEFLTGGRHIKLKIAIGKGKKHYDKRETIKKRDQQRDTLRKLKH